MLKKLFITLSASNVIILDIDLKISFDLPHKLCGLNVRRKSQAGTKTKTNKKQK